MRISGIIWLEDIIEKLYEKHAVRQQEVRETLDGRPLFRRVEKGHRTGKKELSQQLSKVAEERGVSAETLLNLWVQERLLKYGAPEAA